MTRRKKLDETNNQAPTGQNLEFSHGKPGALDGADVEFRHGKEPGTVAGQTDCTDVHGVNKCAETDVSSRIGPRASGDTAAQFDARGKFARGNTIGARGRMPRQTVDMAYIDAFRAGMPPDRVMALLDKAIELAIATKSARGIMAAVQFATDYTLGKAKQRVGSAPDRTLAGLLAGVDTSRPLMPDENEEE